MFILVHFDLMTFLGHLLIQFKDIESNQFNDFLRTFRYSTRPSLNSLNFPLLVIRFDNCC